MRWYIPVHFYGQPSQIYKKNAKVRVERSQIFKNRFFFYNMEIVWEIAMNLWELFLFFW